MPHKKKKTWFSYLALVVSSSPALWVIVRVSAGWHFWPEGPVLLAEFTCSTFKQLSVLGMQRGEFQGMFPATGSFQRKPKGTALLFDVLTASLIGGLSQGQTGVVVKCEVSCDWRFQPPNTLLQTKGLQLAEASFRQQNTARIQTYTRNQ